MPGRICPRYISGCRRRRKRSTASSGKSGRGGHLSREELSRKDCRAAFVGKELYLNGLNSGMMFNHAAFEKAGRNAGQPARPEKRAKLVIPIIGEIRITRWGFASSALSSVSSEYFIASAPPLENPTICRGASLPVSRFASLTARRVAASQSCQSTSVSPAGTVPWPGNLIPMAT